MVDRIVFQPLTEDDFPRLLKWLEDPFIKTWWDPEVAWTPALIQEKFVSYVQGYKSEKGYRKPLHAFIIFQEAVPIGYIQYYNVYDFPRSLPLEGLPPSLAGLDFFIGEADYRGEGLGHSVLKHFLSTYIAPAYKACFVDPDVRNIAALKTYEKAGFKPIKGGENAGEVWMLWEKEGINNYEK